MRLALFGAEPDTPNRGVSALFMSALEGVAERLDPVEFVVFDNGLGCRPVDFATPRGNTVPAIRYGARAGHRYYRPENLATMLAMSRLGPVGARLNPAIRLIDSCDAVLDVSGGDSFSDLYGRKRFDAVYRCKAIALNRGKPLILLPQTYGPFNDPEVRRMAVRAVQEAAMAWARDTRSYDILQDLLGDRFDPDRHRCGVDMAFSLAPSPAPHLLEAPLDQWIREEGETPPLIGFNVNGLIYNDPKAAISRYGFRADYREVVRGFLSRVLAETTARVVLIPHVMDAPGHYESDSSACLDVRNRLADRFEGRAVVSPVTLDQSQVKWLISRMNWFCGTRMHATIASLSSCVPTATVSYSDKALGVFESCGQARQVFDPRRMDTADIIDALWSSLGEKECLRAEIQLGIQPVLELAAKQLQEVCSHIGHLMLRSGRSPS